MNERDLGTAVVTGASAGVGRATAVALARAGYDVALLARGTAGLDGACRAVEAEGRRALPIAVDVACFDDVAAAGRRVEDELGPVDVWVNDAMTTVFSSFATTDPADFQRAVEVTFLGQVWGTRTALDLMRPRDRGTIVNIGSALAFLGIPLQAAYCSSKFACRGFFEAVRAELLEEGSGIRMRMVHLPAVNTPQFEWCKTNLDHHPKPVPPVYPPEVAAAAIVRAASTGRATRILGSWNKLVVACASVLPDFATHFAAVTGRRSQVGERPISSDRPANLRRPADDDRDYGSEGTFGDQDGGVLDRHFVANLPSTARQFWQATRWTVAGRVAKVPSP
jgi:short-subunit dehydrogenase